MTERMSDEDFKMLEITVDSAAFETVYNEAKRARENEKRLEDENAELRFKVDELFAVNKTWQARILKQAKEIDAFLQEKQSTNCPECGLSIQHSTSHTCSQLKGIWIGSNSKEAQ